MRRPLLILLVFLLNLTWASATDKKRPTNMKFYHLDLEVGIENPYLIGKALCRFEVTADNVNTVILDLSDAYKITKIEGAASFEHSANQLVIILEGAALNQGDQGEVTIYYEGVPPTEKGENGIRRGLVYDTHGTNDNPVVATVCYPDGGYLWFPCEGGLGDKADSIYIDVTIPNMKVKETYINPKSGEKETKNMPLIAVANGVLAKMTRNDDKTKKTYYWRHSHPIAAHHAMIAISNFTKVKSKYKGKGYTIPMNFYIFPETYKQSSAMINRAPEIMACLTRTFGPYPYRDEAFNVTQVGIGLGVDGMPTQTNVLLEDLKGINMYKLVHQMANMWFGNHIAPLDWQDAWITEALATYSEAMWQEYKRGLNVYQIILDEKEYFDGGKLYLDNQSDYSEERLSKKGFYAIHMLRGIMSDVYFFETLKAITSGKRMNGSNFLSTEHFREICEYYASENIERDYSYFFDEWVRGEFYPIYEVSYVVENAKVVLNVNQKKRNESAQVFSMPYKVSVLYDDGTVEQHVLNDNQDAAIFTQAQQQFEIPTSKTVKRVDFDPSNWIFKDLRYVKRVDNERFALEDFLIETADSRRSVKITYNVPKKQDISIALIRVADGVSITEDQTLDVKEFKRIDGAQKHQFKIPLDYRSRGAFRIEVRAKGETYSKVIRLKRVKAAF